jgi:hypothetical protein
MLLSLDAIFFTAATTRCLKLDSVEESFILKFLKPELIDCVPSKTPLIPPLISKRVQCGIKGIMHRVIPYIAELRCPIRMRPPRHAGTNSPECFSRPLPAASY